MANDDDIKRIETTLTKIWNRQTSETKQLEIKYGSLLDFLVKHGKRIKALEAEVAALKKDAAKAKKAAKR